MDVLLVSKIAKTRNSLNKTTAATLSYKVTGVSDGLDSSDKALDAAYNVMPKEIDLATLLNFTSENLGGGTFSVEAEYGEESGASASGSVVNDSSGAAMSFGCSAGSTTIKRAIDQTSNVGAPDVNKFIGWNGKNDPECEIAGVEIVTGIMRETYTKMYDMSRLDTPFRRNIGRMTGKVNSTWFKGWAPGEVLFLGADFSGQVNSKSKIAVSYNFAITENEDDVNVGGVQVVNKKGWQYIWSISNTSAQDGKIFLKTLGVYVSMVYREVDFGRLGV